ncbi:MAG: hypothetical protein Q9225_004435 [Loekoesia sp. 1 TL-2023]
MESVAIFGLVCGVIQVVDFSNKVLSTCKELYEKGSLAEHEDLDFMSVRLINLRSDLLAGRQRSSALPNQPGRQDVIELAGKCSQTALKLHEELEKLKPSVPGKKHEAFRISWKTIWRKKNLEKLEKDLHSFQRILNTKILSNIQMQLDSQVLEQGDAFKALSESMKQLTTSFANEKLSFDQIARHMNDMNDTMKEYFSYEFSKLKEEESQERYQKEVLASLHFAEIKSRQEAIKDAHKQTFQWIFDPSGEEISPWSNFVRWLENGSGFYWINGKAGSGKSTLMNYIQEDSRTIEALHKWAGSNKLTVPVFFFWAAGSDLQKSLCGLLRSLIYQLLKQELSLAYVATEYEIIGSSAQERTLLTAWTEKKLRMVLSNLCHQISSSSRICLFIDGLDECAGDHHALIDLLEEVVQNTQVKCCLSSRPERPFTRLKTSAMLKLQDLTRKDISRFVHTKFSKHIQDERVLSETTNVIVEKADGVFLWADLVTNSQIKGIRNGDDEKTLLKRLESLPVELDDVYSQMLERIEELYYEEVSRYEFILSDRSAWEPKELSSSAASVDWSSMAVKFCHRTAKDFFVANSKGRSFISSHLNLTIDRKLLHAAIKLAKMSMCQLAKPQVYIWKMLTGIIKEALKSDKENDWMPMGFLDHVDQVIAALDQEYNGLGPSSYWFHRWGPDNKTFCFTFREIGSSQTVEAAADNDQIRPIWFPNSFLGVATLFGLWNYAHMKLEKNQFDIGAEEIDQLMYCTTIENTGLSYKSLVSKRQLGFILQLVSLGAGLKVRPPEKLWKRVLLWLYKDVVYNELGDLKTTKTFREVIKAIVDCGVDPFPKLSVVHPLSGHSGKGGSLSTPLDFEIDTALAPFMYAVLKDDQDSPWMQLLEESRQSPERQRDKKLRFWASFYKHDYGSGSESSNESGDSDGHHEQYDEVVVMTKEQIQSLHECIQAVSTASSSDTRQATRFQLGQTLWSINNEHNRLLFGNGIVQYQLDEDDWERKVLGTPFR